MSKVTAQVTNNNIIISGYINGGDIVISDKSIRLHRGHKTSVDERELSSVYQMLKDQLDINGKSHSEIVSAIKGVVEIDFSTKIDLDDLFYDLNKEGEAKINVTGDSESHINSLINIIRLNTSDKIEIIVDKEKTNKGYELTYIRVYA